MLPADEITRTATQVRLPGTDVVHDLAEQGTTIKGARWVRTRCGISDHAHLAVLTTHPATCRRCDLSAYEAMGRRRKLALL